MTESSNRIKAPPLEDTMNFLLLASQKAEKRADQVYRSQTSMLQWLRRRGHKVDFSPVPTFEPELGAGRLPPASPILHRFDGKPCPYCSEKMKRGTKMMPTRDHVRPRRAGGTLANGNCLVVCASCNNDKADMTLTEFIEWLEKRDDYRRARVVRATIARVNPQEEIRIGKTIIVFDDEES